jgi:hypothetical protein
MIYLIIYYIIGVIVSIYFIYHYRFSVGAKSDPKRTDAIGGLIGPWLFPVQIILHFLRKKK